MNNKGEFIELEIDRSDLDDFGGPNVKEQCLKLLNCGHIIQVGAISKSDIEAICIQSSHPSDKPHKINITTSTLWIDWKFSCSCKAGLSQRCKHIYAVLCHIERFKKIEVLTCTQKEQRWNLASKKVANSVLQPSKIVDLPEVKKKTVEYKLLPAEKELFTEVMFGAKKSAVSKFMSNYMNRKKGIVPKLDSVPPTNIVEPTSNECEPISKEVTFTTDDSNSYEVALPKDDTVESYLNQLFGSHNLKQKIHFFDEQSTPSHVIQFYNKSICIDSKAAVALHNSTIGHNRSFERKKGKRVRIKTEDCYSLFTFFRNKNRTVEEFQKKALCYLKRKDSAKSLKTEQERQSCGFDLYSKQSDEIIEKSGLLINPTCPWLCRSPDGFSLGSKKVIKIKYFIDQKDDGFTAMLRKLSYLKCENDSSGGVTYELRKKHKYYAELQLNMSFLNCHESDFILLNSEGSFHVVKVQHDPIFASDILTTLKSIYMSYCLNFIFENMLTDSDKLNFK